MARYPFAQAKRGWQRRTAYTLREVEAIIVFRNLVEVSRDDDTDTTIRLPLVKEAPPWA